MGWGADQGDGSPISHAIWADDIFFFAMSFDPISVMAQDLTYALSDHRLSWKPASFVFLANKMVASTLAPFDLVSPFWIAKGTPGGIHVWRPCPAWACFLRPPATLLRPWNTGPRLANSITGHVMLSSLVARFRSGLVRGARTPRSALPSCGAQGSGPSRTLFCPVLRPWSSLCSAASLQFLDAWRASWAT